MCQIENVSYPRNILGDYKEQWRKISDMLGESRTLDLSGKTIFVQPETIMATKSGNEELVIYDDHIILGSWSLGADAICRNYLFGLIPEDEEINLIKSFFERDFVFGNSDNCYQKPPKDEFLILAEYNLDGDVVDTDDWEKYIAARESFKKLWNYQVTTLGEDVVLKSVYQYMISPNRTQNEVDFLYNLGGDEFAYN